MSQNIFPLIINIKKFIRSNFFPETELTKDIIFLLKKLNFKSPIIFDVGAYHGLWISKYLKKFPNTKAYLFEPSSNSFLRLSEKFKNNKKVTINQIALSNELGTQVFNLNTKQYTNSLLDLDNKASDSWINDKLENIAQEEVLVNTLDNFMLDNNLKRINLLKLDVQGYESRVLDGALNTLTKGMIDFVLLEVIVAPTYNKQSKVSTLFDIFEKCNFKLYGIYDIEKSPKRSKIQQFDALFYNTNLDL